MNAMQASQALAGARDADADADALARFAVQALRDEALLSPKPALVDARGSGAHDDLDLARMLRSAQALALPLRDMARCAVGARVGIALRARLAEIGRVAETRMLMATGGSNAHRGAIWALGLLVAARAHCGPSDPATVCDRAARIARCPDPARPDDGRSHGARAVRLWGAAGARGQARAGFPHVLRVGLPVLRAARAGGGDPRHARLDALLAIMARLDDTCLLHRGGREALECAQHGARRVLSLGGSGSAAGARALLELDAALLARRASPGGAADLLAASLFLDATTRD